MYNEKNNHDFDQQNEQDNYEKDLENMTNEELASEGDFTKPRRLHPAAMFFNLVKLFKETILGLGIGLIITFKESLFYFILFVSLFLVLFIVFSILSWYRFTYRVEDNELRIEEGIFIRKKRYISINRIHKIDLTANVVHRIFRLVNVQIDTASSGEGAEVNLSAVKVSDGVKLRKALKKTVNTLADETDSDVKHEYPKERVSWKRLFIAGTTSGSVGIILAAVFAGFTQIEELIPENIYESTFNWLINLSIMFIVLLVIVVLFILWIFGIAGTMIKYGNFTIEKREKELFIKRGLLETKELTIPFDRIQAIGIEQTLLRQPIKFVQVFAIVAGGSFDKMEPFPVIFPIMRESEVNTFLEKFLPDYEFSNEKLIPLAKRGRKFYLFNNAIFFALALVPTIYFFPSYSWIPIVLLVISLWFGWLQHKDGGYYMDGKQFVLRRRSVSKVTISTFHHRIQALEKKQHIIQSKQNLATAEISLLGIGGLGSHYTLRHLENEDANKIGDWYSYRKNENE